MRRSPLAWPSWKQPAREFPGSMVGILETVFKLPRLCRFKVASDWFRGLSKEQPLRISICWEKSPENQTWFKFSDQKKLQLICLFPSFCFN